MSEKIPLTLMESDQTGKVIEIYGGRGMVANLENLGVRIGTKIRKVTPRLMSGPVVVSYGNTQVGIGFGMAQRIIIEVET